MDRTEIIKVLEVLSETGGWWLGHQCFNPPTSAPMYASLQVSDQNYNEEIDGWKILWKQSAMLGGHRIYAYITNKAVLYNGGEFGKSMLQRILPEIIEENGTFCIAYSKEALGEHWTKVLVERSKLAQPNWAQFLNYPFPKQSGVSPLPTHFWEDENYCYIGFVYEAASPATIISFC